MKASLVKISLKGDGATTKILGGREVIEIPLAMLPVGAKGKITRICGGRGVIRRLSEMGFIKGVEVKVTHSHGSHNPRHGGPLVIEVKDSRVALGRGVAMKVMVEEIDG